MHPARHENRVSRSRKEMVTILLQNNEHGTPRSRRRSRNTIQASSDVYPVWYRKLSPCPSLRLESHGQKGLHGKFREQTEQSKTVSRRRYISVASTPSACGASVLNNTCTLCKLSHLTVDLQAPPLHFNLRRTGVQVAHLGRRRAATRVRITHNQNPLFGRDQITVEDT